MDGALVTSSSSSSQSNDAPTDRWTYDVFLSFYGEDTRDNFVDHLYAALDRAGMYTFKDDEKLIRGKPISLELMKAIEESMVTVVVFSKNYAYSRWCLEELVKIIETWHLMGQIVLPVFYKVNPSDVRGQKGSFYSAFRQHELDLFDDIEKVKRWRKALVTAISLSGWTVSKTASGNEVECIKQVVQNILSYFEYRPTENLFGMDSRVKHVKSLLDKGESDVCVIGIWGMGGIGKTTIARAVYHQISYEFDGSCFLEDVRENGSDKKGLKSLQEKLLSEVLMEDHFKIKDCDDGICQIRRRLGRKKCLIVLDDVDNFKHLEFLAGSHEWFGPGSRIMITTRDSHLLSFAQEKYAPELLNQTEAMMLFSKYAFKANSPPKAYEELSHAVVSHTGHLPLALKVLGSHFGGRTLDFWQSALNVLTKIPHKEINEILKLSFDGLNILERKIFLYIAYFFKGKEKQYVTRILDSCGFEAVSGIIVLIEKSLLTVSGGKLHMHDLILEMGRCIVYECYPNMMVWSPDRIKEAKNTILRPDIVEAIVDDTHYDLPDRPMFCCRAKVFKSMNKLRLLDVKGRFTSSESTCFPEQLRWLCWFLYPFQSFRITRGMTKLVGLEMRCGDIEYIQIDKEIILTNLKFINLRSSPITSFPDVSGFPNLESLILYCCSRMEEIHQSVFLHEKIIHLDLSACHSLRILASSIHMKSLQTLLLHHCMILERFPEVSGEMGRLLVININACHQIRRLPSSIRLFTGLNILTLGKFTYSMFEKESPCNLRLQGSLHLNSLRVLVLKDHQLKHNDFPDNLHNAWPSMEELNLRANYFNFLPASITRLSLLKYLNLTGCFSLKELPELPSLIQVLRANGCTSLEKIEDLTIYKWLFKISLYRCSELLKDQQSQNHLANMQMKSFVQKCAAVNHRLSILVLGSKIPKWFSNQRLGNKIPLNLPQRQITKMIGLAICCCLPWAIGTPLEIKFTPYGNKNMIDWRPSRSDKKVNHVWIGYISIDFIQNICHGFESENLLINFECPGDILECGVCVIYKNDVKQMTRIGSWIPDYDELGRIDHASPSSKDLQHGRWSKPTFFLDDEKPEHHKTVSVSLGCGRC